MKIIEYFRETKKREFIDCRITSLRDFFGYYNIDLNSYDIFVLGQTIDCSLLKFKLKNDSPLQLGLLGGTHLELEQNVFKSLRIKYEKKRFSEDLRADIKRYIDQEKPIIARIDIRYLYNPERIQKKIDIHCVSTVIVCGYDFEDEDCVYIELKERHNSPLKKVKFGDFQKAISSKIFPLEIDQVYFEPKIDESTVSDIRSNYMEYLLKAFNKMCDIFLKGDSVTLENQYEYKKIESGLFVLKEVIQMNQTIEDYLMNPAMSIDVKKRIFAMYFQTIRDMLTPGSNYCYRLEFGETLIEMSKKLEHKALKERGKSFKDIAITWRKFCRKISKWDSCNDLKEMQRYFLKINQMLEKIFADEYEEFTLLSHIIKHKMNA